MPESHATVGEGGSHPATSLPSTQRAITSRHGEESEPRSLSRNRLDRKRYLEAIITAPKSPKSDSGGSEKFDECESDSAVPSTRETDFAAFLKGLERQAVDLSQEIASVSTMQPHEPFSTPLSTPIIENEEASDHPHEGSDPPLSVTGDCHDTCAPSTRAPDPRDTGPLLPVSEVRGSRGVVSMRPNAKKAKKRAKLLDRANKQVSDPMTGKLSQGDPVISSAADGENDRDDTGGKRTKALRENCHLGPFDSDATTAEMTAPVRDSRPESTQDQEKPETIAGSQVEPDTMKLSTDSKESAIAGGQKSQRTRIPRKGPKGDAHSVDNTSGTVGTSRYRLLDPADVAPRVGSPGQTSMLPVPSGAGKSSKLSEALITTKSGSSKSKAQSPSIASENSGTPKKKGFKLAIDLKAAQVQWSVMMALSQLQTEDGPTQEAQVAFREKLIELTGRLTWYACRSYCTLCLNEKNPVPGHDGPPEQKTVEYVLSRMRESDQLGVLRATTSSTPGMKDVRIDNLLLNLIEKSILEQFKKFHANKDQALELLAKHNSGNEIWRPGTVFLAGLDMILRTAFLGPCKGEDPEVDTDVTQHGGTTDFKSLVSSGSGSSSAGQKSTASTDKSTSLVTSVNPKQNEVSNRVQVDVAEWRDALMTTVTLHEFLWGSDPSSLSLTEVRRKQALDGMIEGGVTLIGSLVRYCCYISSPTGDSRNEDQGSLLKTISLRLREEFPIKPAPPLVLDFFAIALKIIEEAIRTIEQKCSLQELLKLFPDKDHKLWQPDFVRTLLRQVFQMSLPDLGEDGSLEADSQQSDSSMPRATVGGSEESIGGSSRSIKQGIETMAAGSKSRSLSATQPGSREGSSVEYGSPAEVARWRSTLMDVVAMHGALWGNSKLTDGVRETQLGILLPQAINATSALFKYGYHLYDGSKATDQDSAMIAIAVQMRRDFGLSPIPALAFRLMSIAQATVVQLLSMPNAEEVVPQLDKSNWPVPKHAVKMIETVLGKSPAEIEGELTKSMEAAGSADLPGSTSKSAAEESVDPSKPSSSTQKKKKKKKNNKGKEVLPSEAEESVMATTRSGASEDVHDQEQQSPDVSKGKKKKRNKGKEKA